jgi:hypothetical protein
MVKEAFYFQNASFTVSGAIWVHIGRLWLFVHEEMRICFMEKPTFWGKQPSPGTRITLPIGFVVCVVISSIVLAWTFVSVRPPKAAHAAGILTAQTKTNPWGVALDTVAQHLWIAEPGCDASPVWAVCRLKAQLASMMAT